MSIIEKALKGDQGPKAAPEETRKRGESPGGSPTVQEALAPRVRLRQ